MVSLSGVGVEEGLPLRDEYGVHDTALVIVLPGLQEEHLAGEHGLEVVRLELQDSLPCDAVSILEDHDHRLLGHQSVSFLKGFFRSSLTWLYTRAFESFRFLSATILLRSSTV